MSKRQRTQRVFTRPVATEAVAQERLSFPLVAATQCLEGQQYPVSENEEVAVFLLPSLAAFVRGAAGVRFPVDVTAASAQVRDKLQEAAQALDDEFTIVYVKVPQLRRVATAPAEGADIESSDSFVSYTSEGKQFVMSPQGRHYQVAGVLHNMWHHQLCFVLRREDDYFRIVTQKLGAPGADLHQRLRGDASTPAERKQLANAAEVHVEVCVWDDSLADVRPIPFSGTQTALPLNLSGMQDYKAHRLKVFSVYDSSATPEHWPGCSTLPPRPVIAGAAAVTATDVQEGSKARFTFSCRIDEFGRKVMAYKSGEDWETCCNFELVKVAGMYMFSGDNAAPGFHKLVCRLEYRSDVQKEAFLPHDAEDRSADCNEYDAVVVEVMIQLSAMKDRRHVSEVFARHYIGLITTMTPDMLHCWVSANTDLATMPVEHCIIRFGRQPDGDYVTSNLAWDKAGRLMTLKDSRKTVMDLYFRAQETPLFPSGFPKNIVCPISHVRYAVALELWHNRIPQFFRNNQAVTRCVFGHTLLHLHTSHIYNGETGLPRCNPTNWSVSYDKNTGKTQSMFMCASVCGKFNAAFFGGDITKAAEFCRVNQFCDLPLFIDEFHSHTGESAALKTFIHALYDGTERNVQGKEPRTPHCGAFFTSNQLPNKDDAPFLSRICKHEFESIRSTGEHIEHGSWESLSMLLPDLTNLTIDGKLDREHIEDCTAFLNKLNGKEADRTANMWGLVLYFSLVANRMFQGTDDMTEGIVEHCVNSSRRMVTELTGNATLLERFALAVQRVRDARPNPLDSSSTVMHWHNMRLLAAPFHPVFNSTGVAWIAFHPDLVVQVISSVLRVKFAASELVHACLTTEWARVASCRFWDPMLGGWPIVVGEEGAPKVPMTEQQMIEEGSLKLVQNAIFLREDAYLAVVNAQSRGVSRGSVDNWRQLCLRDDTDPFFDKLVGGEWGGYRVLKHCPLAQFCGGTNLMANPFHEETQADIEPLVVQAHEEWVQQNFSDDDERAALWSTPYCDKVYKLCFNYDFPSFDRLTEMPPGLLYCPFRFRNAPTDRFVDVMHPPWMEQTQFEYDWDSIKCGADEQTDALGGSPGNARDPGSKPEGDYSEPQWVGSQDSFPRGSQDSYRSEDEFECIQCGAPCNPHSQMCGMCQRRVTLFA